MKTEKQKTHMINFVRYADDFIVTGDDPEFLEREVLPVIKAFLSERGLQLSEEKTGITHINDGFDFLGQNIRKYNGKLLIKPSKNSKKAFMKKIRDIIGNNKTAAQEMLIRKLNPIIRGWVNYHRFAVSSETFGWIDYQIFKALRSWAKRRHKRKGGKWIAAKYWHSIDRRNWTFAADISKSGEETRYLSLEYATDTKIIRFKKIVAEANPFDERWNGYFEARDGEKMLNSTKGRERLISIWKRQKCRCAVCRGFITSETGFKTGYNNKSLVMLHPNCDFVKCMETEPGYVKP